MRRGSVSSWEPWARRNSANMAQISGSRSEFMTSDLAVSDIEYKRKGGWFLSYKKTAAIVFAFIIGITGAVIIGVYITLWRSQSSTSLKITEKDEIEGIVTPTKFSISPSVLPTLYDIELTPVLEKNAVKSIKGRVTVHFTYNESKPLSQLVLNAKNITVHKTKLFSHDDQKPRNNVHSRKRRDDANAANSNSSDSSTTATSIPEVTTNAINITSSTSSDAVLNVTSMDIGNATTSNYSSNENITVNDKSNLTETTTNLIAGSNNESSSKKGDVVSTSSIKEAATVTTPSTSTRMYAETTRIQSSEISINNNDTDTVDGFYVIYPDTPIERGVYSVDIIYEAQIDGQSTLANVYDLEGQTRWLLASELKPLGARMLYPSFDDPELNKARFSLSVARPDTLFALANMPLESSEPRSDGWLMDHFEKSPPLSSDKLAFMIGDLQPIREPTIAETGIPIILWDRSIKPNGTNFIVDKIGKVTRNLNELFSIPYSMPKLDIVVLPGLITDGVGSTGLISVRETLFYLTDESSAITKELAIKNLIKLMAEQWLGGMVSTRTLSDSWFLEGSLIYLQHLLAEKVDPTLDSSNSFGVIQHTALEADSYDVSKSLETKFAQANVDTIHLKNIYEKGACLIRMLHNVISDSGFTNGYKIFLSRWTNSSAGVSDFFNAMSDKVDLNRLPNGVSLTEVMTSWVAQGGFPLITVTRNYETASAIIRQEQFTHLNHSTTLNNKFWYVPLTYLSDGDDWSSASKLSWLKKDEKMNLDNVGKRGEKKWVLFNVNQTGYYRVNYDLDNWNLLSSALNSTLEKFPVTTRTSLVDDALSLAWGGWLGYPTALNLIRYLREKETHHSPWTVAFQNMIKLNNLLHNTPAYSSFQEFMVKFISPLFKKVTTTGEESQIKLMAIKWACLVDNPECRSYIKTVSNVSEHLETTYQCTSAKFGGKAEWDSLLSKTLKATDKDKKFKLLTVLPCFQVEWILQSLLHDILKGEKFVEPEIIVLLQSFGENPSAARSTFKFVRRHWNDIFQRYSKSYPISKAFLIAAINGVTDDQDMKDLQIFKEEYYEKLKFLGHTLAIGEAEARSRSSWLKMNLISVQEWLENYIKGTS